MGADVTKQEIDAIRDRCFEAELSGKLDEADYIFKRLTRDDIPKLLAALEQVTAERDALLRHIETYDSCAAETYLNFEGKCEFDGVDYGCTKRGPVDPKECFLKWARHEVARNKEKTG